MERKYQLSVTSDTTSINVQSVNSDEVARIAQLAGLVEPYKGTMAGAITPAPADVAVPAAMSAVDAWVMMSSMQSFDMWDGSFGMGVMATIEAADMEGGFQVVSMELTLAVP